MRILDSAARSDALDIHQYFQHSEATGRNECKCAMLSVCKSMRHLSNIESRLPSLSSFKGMSERSN